MTKPTKQQEANRIIDAMGGTSTVAELFEVTTGAISQWRNEGIPKPWLFSIKLLRPDLFGSTKKRVTVETERRRDPGRRETDKAMGRRSRLPSKE